MKVRVNRPEKEWGPVRQAIFWILFCLVLIIASFEAGYLIKTFEKDETRAEIRKLNGWVLDHGGRIESLETGGQKGGKAGKRR
jgi:hypothetical protein